jgi:hypothetical protein
VDQRSPCIIYAIETTNDGLFAALFGDSDDGAVNEWEKQCREKIAAFDKQQRAENPKVLTWKLPRGSYEFVPISPYKAEPPLLGFYVAVGGSGKDGLPFLTGFPLDDVGSVFGKEIAAAKERWDRFAAWAKEKGVDLPEAQLYFSETETA